MPFKKGNPGGPGRPKGNPNRLNRDLKEMILGALKAKNGQKYLEKVAEEDPRTFCAFLGRVLPMTLNGEVRHDVSVELQAILQAHDDRVFITSKDLYDKHGAREWRAASRTGNGASTAFTG